MLETRIQGNKEIRKHARYHPNRKTTKTPKIIAIIETSNPRQRLGLMSHLAHHSISTPYLRRIRPPSEIHATQRHLRHSLLLPAHAFSSSCDLMVRDMCLDACLDQTLMKTPSGIDRIRTVECEWKCVLCKSFISKRTQIEGNRMKHTVLDTCRRTSCPCIWCTLMDLQCRTDMRDVLVPNQRLSSQGSSEMFPYRS